MPFGRESQVLAYVNHVRSVIGLDEIPCVLPGNVGDSARCPIANSIQFGANEQLWVEVTESNIEVDDDSFSTLFSDHSLDSAVSSWISDFDAKLIPELIA